VSPEADHEGLSAAGLEEVQGLQAAGGSGAHGHRELSGCFTLPLSGQ